MKRRRTVIAKAPLARILVSQGAKRVSDAALDAFSEQLTKIAKSLCDKAVSFSEHASRNTVTDKDIKLASE